MTTPARRPFALILAGLVIVSASCRRLERAAEDAGGAAAERARSVLLAREEKQLQAVLRKLRDVAARSRSVTIYDIANQFDENYAHIEAGAKLKVFGYPVLRHTSRTTKEAAPLIAILTDRKSYFPSGDGWTCMFEPHHILRVAAGDQVMTVIICIHCGDVTIYDGDTSVSGASVLPAANTELTRILGALG